jgi:hypothetical protein
VLVGKLRKIGEIVPVTRLSQPLEMRTGGKHWIMSTARWADLDASGFMVMKTHCFPEFPASQREVARVMGYFGGHRAIEICKGGIKCTGNSLPEGKIADWRPSTGIDGDPCGPEDGSILRCILCAWYIRYMQVEESVQAAAPTRSNKPAGCCRKRHELSVVRV